MGSGGGSENVAKNGLHDFSSLGDLHRSNHSNCSKGSLGFGVSLFLFPICFTFFTYASFASTHDFLFPFLCLLSFFLPSSFVLISSNNPICKYLNTTLSLLRAHSIESWSQLNFIISYHILFYFINQSSECIIHLSHKE